MNLRGAVLSGVALAALVVVLMLVVNPDPPGMDDETERDAGAGSGTPDAPEADAGTGESAEPRGPRLVVSVIDDAGRPCPGAVVILVKDGRRVGRGVTRASGDVSLRAPGGDGDVAVLPGHAPPIRRKRSLEAGRVEILLPAGAVVEGRVLVGDAPPDRPLEMKAWSRVSFSGFESPGEVFRGESLAWNLRARTGADGAFAFRGLPVDWKMFLSGPKTHRLVDPPGNGIQFTVTAPTSGLVIRLRRLPVLTGRVVDAEGRGAPQARVRIVLRTADGGSSLGPNVGADGRFRMAVSAQGILAADLTWSDRAGTVKAEDTIDPKRFESDIDLGDLVLPGIREVRLRVVGPDGEPVTGAWVCPDGERSPMAGPSDSTGGLTITTASAVESLRVAALGRGQTVVSVKTPARPIPVRLPGGNLLRVRIEGPDGGLPVGVGVLVSSKPPMFQTESGGPDHLLVAAGMSRYWMWGEPEGRDAGGFEARGGTVLLGGVTPGNPIRFEVRDALTETVLVTREISLAEREGRVVVIRVEQKGRALSGRVLDPDGKPVTRATVLALVEKKGRRRTSTDGEGRFRLPALRAESVRLVAYRYGFARREIPDLRIPVGGRELDIVLVPGRSVRLLVVDTAGTPLGDLEVGALAPGLTRPIGGLEEDRGSYVVDDLPPGEVTLFADVGGRRFTVSHDTSIAKAKIAVPRSGSVSVRIRHPLPTPYTHRLRLVPVGADVPDVIHDIGYDLRKDRTDIVPHVFPGRYRILLEVYVKPTPDGDEYALVAEGPEVTVRVGARATAEFLE